MHLPRGRFTDALIALSAFALIFAALTLGLGAAAQSFGFIPAWMWNGGWTDNPLLALVSPLASAFLPRDVLSAVFNGLFLLIAGRFVERALGPLGLGVVFVAGAYGGALARLVLTPDSEFFRYFQNDGAGGAQASTPQPTAEAGTAAPAPAAPAPAASAPPPAAPDAGSPAPGEAPAAAPQN